MAWLGSPSLGAHVLLEFAGIEVIHIMAGVKWATVAWVF